MARSGEGSPDPSSEPAVGPIRPIGAARSSSADTGSAAPSSALPVAGRTAERAASDVDGPETETFQVLRSGDPDDAWGIDDGQGQSLKGTQAETSGAPSGRAISTATATESATPDTGPPVAPSAVPVENKRRASGRKERAERSGRDGGFRDRILPRSVLGIACLILAFAIGAGFSGVVLYSYYQYKLNQSNQRVNALITGYKTQFANAEGNLAATAAAAKASIQNQLRALQQLQSGPATLSALTKAVAPSVFFVHTLDANGQPSVGTAFVVSSNNSRSLLLTSYATVQAATTAPAPVVYVQQGQTSTRVTVNTWDPQYDLALLVLPQGGLHPLTAATPSPAPQPGDRIYAVSGLGSAGASVTQGSIVDVSASGVAVDASIAQAFQGGPLIDQSGQVLAVASRTYAPLGFSSQGVWYAPYVEAACNKVLTCPGGTLVGSS
jgi:S1-C subfamily serine protease